MLGHRKLNLEDYLTILKRRWWVVVIPALIMPLIMFGVTYIVTPQYVSSSLVLVDQQKVPTDFVKSLAAEPLDTRLAYIQQKILSRSSILPIIEKYNLYADQHLTPDERIELVATKALKIEAVESELARSNGLPGFKISFTANDPHTAQQVCAEITSLFTKENVSLRVGQSDDTISFIQQQLTASKQALDDQDQKIADFQKKYFGMLPEDEGGNENIIGALTSNLQATTQAVNTLEGSKSVGEALLAQQQQQTPISMAQEKLPMAHEADLESLQSQESALAAQYQPDYPDLKDVRRKIADLKAVIAKEQAAPVAPVSPTAPHVDSAGVVQMRAQLRGIEVQLAEKQKEQEDLKRQIGGYEAKIQSSPEVDAQYKELTRDVQTDQANYDNLSKELKSAQATNEIENRSEGETFTLLDAANLPLDPLFPKVPVFVLTGVFVGLLIGLGIVALLEYKDTALRTESEVWDLTHLPTLAIIAWSDAAATDAPPPGRFKRLFGRKTPKDVLAGAQG